MPSSKLYPGICDFHVHIGERIGGIRLRDDFRTLDSLAAGTGIAAIGAFVTEDEDNSLPDKLYRMKENAAKNFRGHVHWHLTPVHSPAETVETLLGGDCDLKLYTTYKPAGLFCSYEEIERWMRDLSHRKTRFLVHCEDNDTIERHSGATPFKTPFDHTLRRPEHAEIRAVERVLDLAVKHCHPVHVVHVSTPRAALLIQEAKRHNPDITCETAPHYLFLNEDALKAENGHRWLCSPPLRCENSRGQLVELLQDDCFDILATDHCAFTDADKDRFKDTPEKVPCGLPGLATLFASAYQNLVLMRVISLERLVELVCLRPARLMGIGNEAAHTLGELLGENG